MGVQQDSMAFNFGCGCDAVKPHEVATGHREIEVQQRPESFFTVLK
jgi:hypothetical protein